MNGFGNLRLLAELRGFGELVDLVAFDLWIERHASVLGFRVFGSIEGDSQVVESTDPTRFSHFSRPVLLVIRLLRVEIDCHLVPFRHVQHFGGKLKEGPVDSPIALGKGKDVHWDGGKDLLDAGVESFFLRPYRMSDGVSCSLLGCVPAGMIVHVQAQYPRYSIRKTATSSRYM